MGLACAPAAALRSGSGLIEGSLLEGSERKSSEEAIRQFIENTRADQDVAVSYIERRWHIGDTVRRLPWMETAMKLTGE